MLLASAARLRLYSELSRYVMAAFEVCTGRWTKDRGEIRELERSVAKRVGRLHAVALPQARVGIYLAIKAYVTTNRNEVVLSPYTIADVINMVICAGGKPVFADIERHTCNLDAAEVERLVGPRTACVLATHFYGLVCDVERIRKACEPLGIPVIEDAAQSFGAKIGGRMSGALADVGIYSFGLYKNINAFFGGMLVTDNAVLAEEIRRTVALWPMISVGRLASKIMNGAMVDTVTHPIFFKTIFFRLFRWAFIEGVDAINNKLRIDTDPKMITTLPPDYACRMSPLQARMILCQLDRVEGDMRSRIDTAKAWSNALKGTPNLIMPDLHEHGRHSYWYFTIQHPRRSELVSHVLKSGVDITPSYHRNCAGLPCFSDFVRDCPNAAETADTLIYLPTYPGYPRKDLESAAAAIRDFSVASN